MHSPPKTRGPAGFDAFVRPAQSPGYHTPGSVRVIDMFASQLASQNFLPSPQPEADQGLTPTREITPALKYCVTKPQPRPPPSRGCLGRPPQFGQAPICLIFAGYTPSLSEFLLL